MRIATVSVVVVAVLVVGRPCLLCGQQNPYGQIPVASLPEPYLMLIRDPVVHGELKLDDEQTKAVNALTDELDPRMWRTRNQPPQKAEEEIRKLTAVAEERMAEILSFAQGKRLEQIRYRVAGMEALLGEKVSEKLKLAADQESQIEKLIQKTEKAADALRRKARDSNDREKLLFQAAMIAFEQERQIATILSREQRIRLRAMIGSTLRIWRLGCVKFRPPELREDAWVNSEPLTFADVRGKVVAVHFWTYGNLSCVRDYPVHHDWQSEFGETGLTIIGIHTPQTKEERDADRVRAKASEVGLTFPILIDNNRENWNAWGNSVWPSLYLVGKQGYVRYWWLGELGAKEGQGQKLMRQRIEELLAEE